MSRRRGRLVGTILGFTLVSRAMGFLRELIIAAGFGFSRATDGFYQLAATPTYLFTFLGGPFSTAYIAWSNRADAPEESLRVAILLRWLAIATGLLSAAFLGVALRLAVAGPVGDRQLLPPLLMALACAATGLIGLSAAVANARAHFAQAQAVLFVNNASFVVLLGLGAWLLHRRVELVLTGAFTGAALIAALYGWRVIHTGVRAPAAAAQRVAAAASCRRVFVPMLGMAGVETIGFLASQAAVLWLAAQSGAGVTSAGSLAQRIALTANGLVIGPLANIAMVRLMRLEPEAARHYQLRVAGLTLAGLVLIAAAIGTGALLVGRYSHSATMALLCRLIPAYSVWLVAQGANIMLNRLSFARGAARRYTVVTLAGYALANVARYAVWRSSGFGPAIAAGAGVELGAALAILAGVAWRRGVRPPPRASEPVIIATEADGSGMGRFTVELANALEVACHPVTMIAREQPYPLSISRRVTISPPTAPDGWRKTLGLARQSLALAAAVLREAGPGRPLLMVHIAPTLPASLAPIVAARLKRARIVLSLHDFYPHTLRFPAPLQGLERWLYRVAYRACDLIVTNNAAQSRRLIAEAKVPARRVRTLFHGPFVVTKLLHEPQADLCLLVFGSLRPNKRVLEAICALRQLRAEGIPVALRIAGAPRREDAAYWERCLAEIPCGDPGFDIRPRFIADDELACVLSGVDAMLCPYAGFDSQSGVVVMAVSNGVPVIATAAAAHVAQVDSGAAPWPQVADRADAAAIADAVRGFIAVPAPVRQAFAADLQSGFLAAAGWETLAAGYVQAMRELDSWP